MIHFSGRGILLDIEGTTSSISFVQDVLFPYARRHLGVALRVLWNESAMPRIREELARLHGARTFEEWTGGIGMPPEHRYHQMKQALVQLMDQDAKVSPLKEIQGMIWRAGYRDGTLRSQVYPDVPKALKRWKEKKISIRIYSSGSVEAQKTFFQHVEHHSEKGLDLTSYLSGYYDTTTGPKREEESYRKITQAFGLPAQQILFLSDIPDELGAARSAGMRTGLVRRPGNAELTEPCDHQQICSFEEVQCD